MEDVYNEKTGDRMGTGFIPITTEIEEIVNFLKDKIPYVLDLEKEDIKYDKNNIYYKIYKYIRKLEKEKEEK